MEACRCLHNIGSYVGLDDQIRQKGGVTVVLMAMRVHALAAEVQVRVRFQKKVLASWRRIASSDNASHAYCRFPRAACCGI